MVDLLFRHSLFTQWYSFRFQFVPTHALGRGLCMFDTIHLSSRADQRVAIDKLRTKPGHKTAFINGVQPQRDLCQLHCDGVQVDAVHIAIGNIHLYLLQFIEAVFVPNDHASLFFLAGDIGFGQLVDRLVQEGGAAHGWLADGQFEDLICGLAFQEFLQGILHQALCQHLWRIVRGRFFTLSACQAIDEGAFLIHAELTFFLTMLVTHAFIFGVLIKFCFRDEIAYIQLIKAVSCTLDFVQVLFGDKASVGKQGFVHGPHLVDA